MASHPTRHLQVENQVVAVEGDRQIFPAKKFQEEFVEPDGQVVVAPAAAADGHRRKFNLNPNKVSGHQQKLVPRPLSKFFCSH